MKGRNRSTTLGFTLIELLVVVLILGILVTLALPSYMGSLRNGRTNVADNNSRAIANAIKSAQVKLGLASHSGLNLNNSSVVQELGSIPVNPCTGGAAQSDYQVNLGNPTTVEAKDPQSRCNSLMVFSIYP